MTTTKRVLISGYYGAGNLGDEALLSGLLGGLRARGHEVEVLSQSPARTRGQHSVRAAHRLRGLLPALARCDALVSGGGGLFQDVTSRRSLDYYLAVVATARRLGKRVVIYGQSLGPLSPGSARRVAYALRGLPLGLRDGPSLELAASWGLEATPVADAALALAGPGNDTRRAVAEDEGGRAAAPHDDPPNVRPDSGRRGLLLVPRGGHPAVTEALVALAQRARAGGRPVACLPLHPQLDAEPARRIAEAAPGVALCNAGDPQDAVAHAAGAAFVASGRLHGLIFAALAGVPHAGLAYDPKVTGFLAESGGARFELPLGSGDLDALERLAEAPPPLDAGRRAALLRRSGEGLAWLDARLREA